MRFYLHNLLVLRKNGGCKRLFSLRKNISDMSRDMLFPTMWHFDKADSDEPVQPPFKLENSK